MHLCLLKTTKRCRELRLSGGNFPASCVINEEAVASFISFCLSMYCPSEDSLLEMIPYLEMVSSWASHTHTYFPNIIYLLYPSWWVADHRPFIHNAAKSNMSLDESTLRKNTGWLGFFSTKLSHLASNDRLPGTSRLSWAAPSSSKAGCWARFTRSPWKYRTSGKPRRYGTSGPTRRSR